MPILRGGTEDRRKSGAHKVCNSYKDRKCHCSVRMETGGMRVAGDRYSRRLLLSLGGHWENVQCEGLANNRGDPTLS